MTDVVDGDMDGWEGSYWLVNFIMHYEIALCRAIADWPIIFCWEKAQESAFFERWRWSGGWYSRIRGILKLIGVRF